MGERSDAKQLVVKLENSTHSCSHAFSQCNVLVAIANLYLNIGDIESATVSINKILDISSHYKLLLWYAGATVIKGKINCHKGLFDEGIKMIKHGIHLHKSTGSELWKTEQLTILANAYLMDNKYQEALDTINIAADKLTTYGSDYSEAEIFRIKGEAILNTENNSTVVESLFKLAIKSAQKQHSKIFEIKAATSLARLLHHNGHTETAFKILTPAYTQFSEGFDISDVKNAQQLLTILSD